MYIVIENRGTTDFNTIRLIGLSTNKNESNIGQFGSGFKYACAILARYKLKLIVTIGLNKYEMRTIDSGEIVFDEYIGAELNESGTNSSNIIFTDKNVINTSVHKNFGMHDWTQLWFAFREFICNAYDVDTDFEQYNSKEIMPEEGKTKVYIEQDFQVMGVLSQLSDNIRFKEEPIYNKFGIKVYNCRNTNPESSGKALIKGVNVCDIGLSAYDYEFNLKINESRQVSIDSVEHEFSSNIHRIIDEDILANIFKNTLNEKSFESKAYIWADCSNEVVGKAFTLAFGEKARLIKTVDHAQECIEAGYLPIYNNRYYNYWKNTAPTYNSNKRFKGKAVVNESHNALIDKVKEIIGDFEVTFFEPSDSTNKDIGFAEGGIVYINNNYFTGGSSNKIWFVKAAGQSLGLSSESIIGKLVEEIGL